MSRPVVSGRRGVMSRPTPAIVHFRVNDQGRTHCGRHDVSAYTDDREEATCRVCNGSAAEKLKGPRASRGAKGPKVQKKTRPNEPAPVEGLGILLCRLCNKPYRDHPVGWPCPFFRWDQL